MNAAAPAWEFRIPATRGASVIFGARLRQSSTPGAVNLAGCPWRLQRIDNAATGTPLQWIRRSSSTTTNGAGPFLFERSLGVLRSSAGEPPSLPRQRHRPHLAPPISSTTSGTRNMFSRGTERREITLARERSQYSAWSFQSTTVW